MIPFYFYTNIWTLPSIFDLLAKVENQKQYWKSHFQLKAPHIDNKMFRIQVRGDIRQKQIINKLRFNFENKQHKEHQELFFSRDGLHPRSYIIWDCTEIKQVPGEVYDRDPRLTFHAYENKLKDAQTLYNVSSYFKANSFFEKEFSDSNLWHNEPKSIYIYHYLQTKNKLGLYRETLDIINKLELYKFENKIKANILISKGIAHYNLQEFDQALKCFTDASEKYKLLHQAQISFADSLIWKCIVCISDFTGSHDRIYMQNDFDVARENIEEFKKNNPDVPESHYMGRYNGFCVYYEIFIETSKNWVAIEKFAQESYGGSDNKNRVNYGVMAGKYTETIVYLCKYKDVGDVNTIRHCSKLILEVLERYKSIYGNYDYNIKTIWDKIYLLAEEVIKLSKDINIEIEPIEKLLKDLTIENYEIKTDINYLTPLN